MLRLIDKFVYGAPKSAAIALAFLSVGLVGSHPIAEAVDRRSIDDKSMDDSSPRLVTNIVEVMPDVQRLSIQEEPIEPRPPARPGDFRYAVGDRLKITFYEQVGGEIEQAGRRRAQSLIERAELTSEYVVQLSGDVFLPIVGAVSVARLTPMEAEAALIFKARAATGDRLKVSVVVTDREPIYVVGTSSRAGVYKYAPGMLVAQAVALAGGDSGTTDSVWQQFDMAREQERMHKSVERMKRNLAIFDVLMAERQNLKPQPSRRLIELAGESAAEYLDTAFQARELEQARSQLHFASLDKLLAATKADLASSRSRLEHVASVVRERAKRRDDLADRVSRGNSTENLIVQARNELVEIQSSFHEVRSAVARTEIRILELEREWNQAALATQIDREQQLRIARQVISDEEIMLSSIGPLPLKIGTTAATGKGKSEVTYSILRKSASGPVQLAADATSPLEPGDILQIAKKEQMLVTAAAR
jgi:protein involved in polysaccharide export with SLBB domain